MKDTAVVSFGRFNPTTIGHEKLLDKQHKLAIKSNADNFVFMSKSQDAKKNPLSFDEKVKFAKKLMPKHAASISNDKTIRTIFDLMKNIESKGYERVVFVAGSDRVSEYQKLLGKYNGKDYTFTEIRVVSAGDRDPDADGASGMSASKLRKHAVDGNFDDFKKGLPGHPDDGTAKQIFNAVRKGLNMNESKVTKVLKSFSDFIREENDKAKLKKKKMKVSDKEKIKINPDLETDEDTNDK